MKKFKFRFQVMLNKLTREMEKLTAVLAGWQKELHLAEQTLKGYETQLIAYWQEIKEKRKKGLLVEEFILYQRFLAKLQESIKLQEEKIRAIKAKIIEVRHFLLEKNKEKKMMEKLKEADYQEYLQKIEMAEQKLLDELATLGYNRQAR